MQHIYNLEATMNPSNDNWDMVKHKKSFIFVTWLCVALASTIFVLGLYGFFMVVFMGQ